MLVIGVDPGTATTGYGVVDYVQGKEILISYGTIRTAEDTPMELRLLKIHQDFNGLRDQYQPQAVAIEELFHHKNAKTVISVASKPGGAC